MNWFSNIFSKSQSSDSQAEARIIKEPHSENLVTCSKPLSTNSKKLPLETLKQFVPMRNLNDQSIEHIPHRTLTFAKDSIVFLYGQDSTTVFYLLSGDIELQPDSDNNYKVSAKSALANLPLNSGKVCGATAMALTKVTILAVTGELTQLWTDKSKEEITCVELIDINLPEQINDNRFFNSFAQAYRENKLSLPSLPTVAFKLKEAMKDDIGVHEAVDIIHLDPPIVTKLIQVANSPLYAPTSPITNCHDAVTRLGLEATRNLVMGISLKQMFHCKDKQLMKGMEKVWKSSLYVSSLSFVLAAESSNINPEDALLAGLICDIGIIPLIHFAEQYPDEYPDFSELEKSIPFLRGPVGMLLLHTLGFSEMLTQIPHHAEDWHYESGEKLDLTDIVILAKLHSYFGSKKAKDLPYINSIPAYSKLKDGKLNPDFSLKILHQAQKRINAAMKMLA